MRVVSPFDRLGVSREEIARFCRRNHIRKMSLFGSILRDDFRPDSDVDVLVEFEPGKTPRLEVFDIVEELGSIFGRTVDLVERDSLDNPFRRRSILSSAQPIYVDG